MQDPDGMSRSKKAQVVAKAIVRKVAHDVVVDALGDLPWASWLQDLVSLWTGG